MFVDALKWIKTVTVFLGFAGFDRSVAVREKSTDRLSIVVETVAEFKSREFSFEIKSEKF